MLPMEVIEKFTTLEAEVDRLKSENDKLRGLLYRLSAYCRVDTRLVLEQLPEIEEALK